MYLNVVRTTTTLSVNKLVLWFDNNDSKINNTRDFLKLKFFYKFILKFIGFSINYLSWDIRIYLNIVETRRNIVNNSLRDSSCFRWKQQGLASSVPALTHDPVPILTQNSSKLSESSSLGWGGSASNSGLLSDCFWHFWLTSIGLPRFTWNVCTSHSGKAMICCGFGCISRYVFVSSHYDQKTSSWYG